MMGFVDKLSPSTMHRSLYSRTVLITRKYTNCLLLPYTEVCSVVQHSSLESTQIVILLPYVHHSLYSSTTLITRNYTNCLLRPYTAVCTVVQYSSLESTQIVSFFHTLQCVQSYSTQIIFLPCTAACRVIQYSLLESTQIVSS